jgi:hypothetical protein
MAATPYGEYPLVQLTIDVGAATREFTCQFPFGIKVTRSYGSADAATGTDKVTPTVTVAGSTIKTCTVIDSTDTITEDLGVDAAASDFIPANTPFKIVMTFAGTAANVKGVRFVLFGAAKR